MTAEEPGALVEVLAVAICRNIGGHFGQSMPCEGCTDEAVGYAQVVLDWINAVLTDTATVEAVADVINDRLGYGTGLAYYPGAATAVLDAALTALGVES